VAVVDQAPHGVPHLVAAARVQTGGGLVEEQHARPVDQAGGEVEPAAHAPGAGLRRSAAGVGEAEPLQQVGGPGVRLRAAEPEQPADHHQVLPAGEVFVDRGVLAGEPDELPHPLRLAGDVVAGDPGGAGVGPQQGGQHPHGGGLAGAVGAQHAEHGAGGGGEVHAVQGAGRAVVQDEALGLDGVLHGSSSMGCEEDGARRR